MTIELASVNLAYGRDGRGRFVDPAALAAALAELDADVVAVQEVLTGGGRPRALAAALRATDWRCAPTVEGIPGDEHPWSPAEPVRPVGPGDPPAGEGAGIGLFARRPVRRWHVLGLPAGRGRLPIPGAGGLRWLPDEPRAAVAAELDGLTVVATHLSFAPPTAIRQLLRLEGWARSLPGPVVLAGDLNLPGPVPATLTGGTRLVEGPTFPADHPRLQLDHLLSLGAVRADRPRVRRLGISDHRAVTARVWPGRT